MPRRGVSQARSIDFPPCTADDSGAGRLGQGFRVGGDSAVAMVTASAGPVSVWQITSASPVTNGTVPAPDGTAESIRALGVYNHWLTFLNDVAANDQIATLWYFSQTAPYDNPPGSQIAQGVYLGDAVPGGHDGGNPLLSTMASVRGTFSGSGADDPTLDDFFTVTGNPPTGGAVEGQAINTNFLCLSDNTFTATDITGISMTMNGITGTGTITLTFRVATPGCTNYPRPERARWTLTIPFSATRIQ